MASQPTPSSSGPLPPTAAAVRSGWRNKALWCVGLGLLANAAALLYSNSSHAPSLSFDSKALAQAAEFPSDRMLGAHGLYMMPAQLGPSTFGLYLLDVDSGTICVYRASPDTSRLRLMAARSFKFDRFLEDLNNDTPTPKDVQKLVQQQRQREQVENKKDETKP